MVIKYNKQQHIKVTALKKRGLHYTLLYLYGWYMYMYTQQL